MITTKIDTELLTFIKLKYFPIQYTELYMSTLPAKVFQEWYEWLFPRSFNFFSLKESKIDRVNSFRDRVHPGRTEREEKELKEILIRHYESR